VAAGATVAVKVLAEPKVEFVIAATVVVVAIGAT